jgi:hypothetical protein
LKKNKVNFNVFFTNNPDQIPDPDPKFLLKLDPKLMFQPDPNPVSEKTISDPQLLVTMDKPDFAVINSIIDITE